MSDSTPGVPAIAAIVAAVVAVVAGLFVLGSPARAREHRLDDMRVRDLSTIATALNRYWTKHAAMPDTVDSLVSTGLLDRIPTDPFTGVRYPIHLTGGNSYRLCATFAQPLDTTRDSPYESWGDVYRGRLAWRHGAGESCFDLRAETDSSGTPPSGIRLDVRPVK